MPCALIAWTSITMDKSRQYNEAAETGDLKQAHAQKRGPRVPEPMFESSTMQHSFPDDSGLTTLACRACMVGLGVCLSIGLYRKAVTCMSCRLGDTSKDLIVQSASSISSEDQRDMQRAMQVQAWLDKRFGAFP